MQNSKALQIRSTLLNKTVEQWIGPTLAIIIGPDRNAEGMAIGFGCDVCVSVV